jgi:hypothetical protein
LIGEDLKRRRTARSEKGDNKMQSILIIAMLLGVIDQAEALDRGKWIEQTAKASKTCQAKFRKKFGEGNGHSYADCVTDQNNKAVDTCTGNSEFANCVLEQSLKVLEVCDLSGC